VQKGQVVGGKYAIDALIGSGAMGYVVSAVHVELGQSVALKFLRPELVSNPTLVARFATEARAVAKIRSEHVARVFDVGVLDNGAPFIVMELLTGSDLAKVLAERARITAEAAVGYILQACEALAIAHACGIVHRDIKPENLFLAKTMQGPDVIKVLDFGISKLALTGSAIDCGLPLVRTVAPLGSPVYMSPEQIRGSSDADARTDVWSVGCVLYELLAGRAAFDAASITQLCAAILEQPAPSLRQIRGDIPPALDAVVARCLEKEREQRYPDVAELALALLPFAAAGARVSVERCCHILRKPPLPESADRRQTSTWDGESTGLSLRPATLDRAHLVATAVEGELEPVRRPVRQGFGVVAGALFTFALALAFWGLRPSMVEPRKAAASMESTHAPPASALPSGALPPGATLGAISPANPAAVSASPPSASATLPAPVSDGAVTSAAHKNETKSRRTQPSTSKRAARPAPEPDVGF